MGTFDGKKPDVVNLVLLSLLSAKFVLILNFILKTSLGGDLFKQIPF